jgi:hypothetical protein
MASKPGGISQTIYMVYFDLLLLFVNHAAEASHFEGFDIMILTRDDSSRARKAAAFNLS